METLTPVGIAFFLTTLLTIYLFYKATKQSQIALIIIFVWITLQAVASISGFYLKEDTIPPRMALLAGPTLIFIIGLFLSTKGRTFIDSLDLKALTMVHSVRIFVEGVLFFLFVEGSVPQLITFAGRNFDIIAGITAPVIAYFGFRNGKTNRGLLIAWNIICIGLLVNVVLLAVLSAPTPLQKFSFEQPAEAILHFPYTWLPCCVVPLVLFSHLAALRQLFKSKA
jgi:hypothetical protein